MTLRLGVIVPCRNERAVIARKLANLARLTWPAGEHRVVIVDDGSDDGTRDVARDALGPWPEAAPRADVIVNDVRPGKAGAITAGLAALGDTVDVVVLTDADVVFDDDALGLVARAFEASAALGMACGSQRFIESLGSDGRPLTHDGAPPAPAPGTYDIWTSVVRARESRSGRLFSVHGQLLAWRRALALQPTPGLAADDLDLMLQVREAGADIVKLDDALFYEVKTPDGPARRDQSIRRARAYVQLVARRPFPTPRDRAERQQFAFYRRAPLAAPWLALLGALAIPATAGLVTGRLDIAIVTAMLLGLTIVFVPPLRRLAKLLIVIAEATRLERRGTLADRWEMARS